MLLKNYFKRSMKDLNMDTTKFSNIFFGHLRFIFEPNVLVFPFCFDIDRIGISFHCLFFAIQWEWKKYEE